MNYYRIGRFDIVINFLHCASWGIYAAVGTVVGKDSAAVTSTPGRIVDSYTNLNEWKPVIYMGGIALTC